MRLLLLSGVVSLFLIAAASSQALVPVGPVVNGSFEVFVPGGPQMCEVVGNQEHNVGRLVIVDTCSPGAMKAAQWSSPDTTLIGDWNGVGNRRAGFVGGGGLHDLWQAYPNPQQAWSLDFATYRFQTANFGFFTHAPGPGAHIQLGFSLSPGYQQHPWVGIFWEGALQFTRSDMTIGTDGYVNLDPVVHGEIICPAWQPCFDFKAEYDAADDDGKRELLGQARLVQNSFWSFGTSPGQVVMVDNVEIGGAKTFGEGIAA